MDIRKRLFGTCARPGNDDNNDSVSLLPDALATNLLLFDSYIMLSCRLLEFPQIVSTFGYSETLELLKSKCLTINCDPSQIMIWGSTPDLVNSGKAFTYEFVVIRSNDHRDYIKDSFQDLHKNIKLPDKKIIKLKDAIFPQIDLTVRDPDVGNSPELKAAKNLFVDLAANVPFIKKAVILELNNKRKGNISPKDFTVKLHQVNSDIFRAETNIQKIFNLDEYESHEIIQNALFRLADLHQSLEHMQKYTALSSINDNALSLLEGKLEFFAKQCRSNEYVNQFKRILEIKDFPDFEVSAKEGKLRLDKILGIRETREAKEFRNWLPDISSATDEEIKEQIETFKAQIGNFLPTKKGKSLRLLITSGVGLIPVVGNIAGIAASALDSFAPEKVFPSSGPISFINNMLPSAFEFNKKEKPNSYQKMFDI
jgi:hypothetical protein